jgi:hypothetical protein
MADEKKYSARDAAVAVLAKAHEILKKSEMAKAEKVNEIDTPFEKNIPGEIQPKEQVQGEPAKPGARVEEQKAPEANPAENKEAAQGGGNPEWGAEPGHYKLAKFCGHMTAKRKMKSEPKV